MSFWAQHIFPFSEFRKKNAAKKSGAKANEADKKRKLEKDPVAPNEELEGNEDDANGICGDDDES